MTGDMIVVGAGTNTKKSYLVQRMVRNQIINKRPSLYITTEDPEYLFVCRMLADYGNVDPVSVRDRVFENASAKSGRKTVYPKAMPQEKFAEIEAKMRADQEGLFFSNHCPAWPVSKICALIRRHAHVAGVRTVFLDYLQAVHPDGEVKDKTAEVSKNVRKLKKCAEENGVVLVLMSQLNRDSYRKGEEPTINDYKYAGDIENEAQLCVLMWRGDDGILRGKVPKTKWTAASNNKYIIEVEPITGCLGPWKDDFSMPEEKDQKRGGFRGKGPPRGRNGGQ